MQAFDEEELDDSSSESESGKLGPSESGFNFSVPAESFLPADQIREDSPVPSPNSGDKMIISVELSNKETLEVCSPKPPPLPRPHAGEDEGGGGGEGGGGRAEDGPLVVAVPNDEVAGAAVEPKAGVENHTSGHAVAVSVPPEENNIRPPPGTATINDCDLVQPPPGTTAISERDLVPGAQGSAEPSASSSEESVPLAEAIPVVPPTVIVTEEEQEGVASGEEGGKGDDDTMRPVMDESGGVVDAVRGGGEEGVTQQGPPGAEGDREATEDVTKESEDVDAEPLQSAVVEGEAQSEAPNTKEEGGEVEKLMETDDEKPSPLVKETQVPTRQFSWSRQYSRTGEWRD